ncbi:MAG: hypothetical protein K6V97_13920 [Actinomycetia bacterium]|nr:hypothetical protein [Actinomycetes bacterium]
MEKHPLLPVDTGPLDLWYEGPTFLVADKPPGLPLHPRDAAGRGTLVNRLLQTNRWLAEMETSPAPGVVHRLADPDSGLVLVAKTEEAAARLREWHTAGRIRFRYRVVTGRATPPPPPEEVAVLAQRLYGEWTALDIETPWGDTDRLRTVWLGPDTVARFTCYALTLPDTLDAPTAGFALGRSVPWPRLELYTAPT